MNGSELLLNLGRMAFCHAGEDFSKRAYCACWFLCKSYFKVEQMTKLTTNNSTFLILYILQLVVSDKLSAVFATNQIVSNSDEILTCVDWGLNLRHLRVEGKSAFFIGYLYQPTEIEWITNHYQQEMSSLKNSFHSIHLQTIKNYKKYKLYGSTNRKPNQPSFPSNQPLIKWIDYKNLYHLYAWRKFSVQYSSLLTTFLTACLIACMSSYCALRSKPKPNKVDCIDDDVSCFCCI